MRTASRPWTDRAGASDWVLVHDAARPCLARADLDRLLAALADAPGRRPAGRSGSPTPSSARRPGSCAAPRSMQTVERAGLWRALTPQMFRYGRLRAALDAAHAAGRFPTDEAQALEWLGASRAAHRRPPPPTSRSPARPIWRWRRPYCARGALRRQETCMRIGSGIDVHAFGPGDFVMLGRRARRRIRTASWRTPTATWCCTRCATRCSARPASATSASTSRTPTRSGTAPTAGASSRACCTCCAPQACGWAMPT